MNRSAKLTAGIALVLGAMSAQVVLAQEATEAEVAPSSSSGSGMDFSFSGMVRSETAFSAGTSNPLNQRGNVYNRKTVARDSSLIGFFPDTTTRNGQPNDPTLNMQLFRGQFEANVKLT